MDCMSGFSTHFYHVLGCTSMCQLFFFFTIYSYACSNHVHLCVAVPCGWQHSCRAHSSSLSSSYHLWRNFACIPHFCTGFLLVLQFRSQNKLDGGLAIFNLPPPSMNVCTQVWCPLTDWHFIQNVFLSHAYCYQDGLRLYRDPDQVKVIEDE